MASSAPPPTTVEAGPKVNNCSTKPNEPHFFYEDEVFRFSRGGNLQFGMVVENSEFVSSDEEDIDEGSRLKQGYVRVSWHPKGHEEVVRENKIGLADRSLMPGDVVRRLIRGHDTQRGYCRNVSVRASVEIVGTKQIIFGVDSKDLIPLEDFTVDVAVCLGAWVGMVRHIKSKVRVKFHDGSICSIDDHVAEELEDIFDKRDDESQYKRFDFYPGQVLKGPLKLFEEGEFEHCTEELKNLRNSGKGNKVVKVTVVKAEVISLGVHWQCRGYTSSDNQKDPLSSLEYQQPNYVISGEDLKRVRMLNVFEPCTLQIGDRNHYTLKPDDIIMMRDEWRRLEKESFLGIEGEPTNPKSKKNRRLKKIAAKAKSEDVDDDDDEVAQDQICDNQNGLSDAVCCVASSSSSTVSSQAAAAENAFKKRSARGTRESESSNAGRSHHGAPTVTSSVIRTFGNKKRKKLRCSQKKIQSEHHSATPACPAVMASPAIRHVKPGDRVVVETICTKTQASVVWQDGTVEKDIPSRELFPIHALDEQEFFPGDCVVRSVESLGGSSADPHAYGVIQSVDHSGRTCKVQWFRTYTTGSDPKPEKTELTEEPVYDLRDHPDFKYRPGSVVIRVANFPESTENEESKKSDANCFGGQVLDILPTGEISVWWVDGSVSLTWPQDLYKVGEYDSDEGELWDEGGEEEDDSDQEGSYTTEGSWETESEQSIPNDGAEVEDEASLKPKLAANVEKARVAMSRLQEIFQDNPSLQTGVVMKQLLDVYKDGKDLDKLMSTSFFDESNFDGLIEKVRERSRVASTHQQAVHEQVSRLFSTSSDTANLSSSQPQNIECDLTDEKVSKSDNVNNVSVGETSTRSALNESNNSEEVPTRTICSQLCQLIETQLVKSHEEVMKRCGGQAGAFTPEDIAIAPGEEEQDLESIMGQIFKSSLDHFQFNLSSIFPGMFRFRTPPTEVDENGVAVASTSDEVKTPNDDVFSEYNASVSKSTKGNVSALDISATLYGSPEEQKSRRGSTAADESVGEFTMLETASVEHKFKLSVFQPTDPKSFIKFLRKEIQLMRSSLPQGIHVKGFEDRMDLFSVMIKGPERTPYEDGLFFFDMQLPPDYPKAPPIVHYHSYCSDRLNPNLYEDGKVCVSLLGTWSGKGTETWTLNSNLLQLLVSIQGLILVREPYFNEAGYERQKGTQQGTENSRMYNEMAILKLVQSLTRMAVKPPEFFKAEVRQHFEGHAKKLIDRLESWVKLSLETGKSEEMSFEGAPDFPLVPASKGFCISLQKSLDSFREALRGLHL